MPSVKRLIERTQMTTKRTWAYYAVFTHLIATLLLLCVACIFLYAWLTHDAMYQEEKNKAYSVAMERVNAAETEWWNSSCPSMAKMYETSTVDKCKKLKRDAEKSGADTMHEVVVSMKTTWTNPRTIKVFCIVVAVICVVLAAPFGIMFLVDMNTISLSYGTLPSGRAKKRQ